MAKGPDYKAVIQEKFKQLDLSDGVSKEEAIIIAQNYLIEQELDKKYVLRKPEVDERDFGTEWVITFNATYWESIKQANIFGLTGIMKWWISVDIDKKTGKIESVGGPDL